MGAYIGGSTTPTSTTFRYLSKAGCVSKVDYPFTGSCGPYMWGRELPGGCSYRRVLVLSSHWGGVDACGLHAANNGGCLLQRCIYEVSWRKKPVANWLWSWRSARWRSTELCSGCSLWRRRWRKILVDQELVVRGMGRQGLRQIAPWSWW